MSFNPLQFIHKFVFEAITRTAAAVSIGAAALDHKISNNPVKTETVIKPALYQVYKVGRGDWGLFVK